MKRLLIALSTVAALASLSVVPAGARVADADAAAPPTQVTALHAARDGTTVTVTGAATFGGEDQLLVGEDGTGDPPVPRSWPGWGSTRPGSTSISRTPTSRRSSS